MSGLIDYGVIFTFMRVMMYFYGEPDDEDGYFLNGLPALSVIVVWFVYRRAGAKYGSNYRKQGAKS